MISILAKPCRVLKTGHFLLHAHSYLKRKSPGYLYIVLPLPCLTNSRYLTHQQFRSILASTNWEVVAHHDSSKLTYWFLRETNKAEDGRKGDGKVWKREELRKGVAPRNNFCILVKPEDPIERGVEVEKEKEITGEETVDVPPTKEDAAEPAGKKRGKGKGEKSTAPGPAPAAAGNKKRKAEDVEGDGGEKQASAGEAGVEEGGQQKKKKAKKSKAVKGKKIVFGDADE